MATLQSSGGWSRFLWNAHLIIVRDMQCIVFLLTQRVDLGCVGMYYSLWQMCFN